LGSFEVAKLPLTPERVLIARKQKRETDDVSFAAHERWK
jgi:hypothetical protein